MGQRKILSPRRESNPWPPRYRLGALTNWATRASWWAGPFTRLNLVNGPAHHESLKAQLVRAPNQYLGGHGFDSRTGLRIFLCPMRVMLNISSLLKYIVEKHFLSWQLLVISPIWGDQTSVNDHEQIIIASAFRKCNLNLSQHPLG